MYTHTHIYTHTYTHTHIYLHKHTQIHLYANIHTHIYMIITSSYFIVLVCGVVSDCIEAQLDAHWPRHIRYHSR